MQRLIEKPRTAFGFIYPDFQQACRGDILDFVAYAMSCTQELCQTTAVGDQFFKHALGCGRVFVVIEQSLILRNIANRSERCTADLASSFCDWVRHCKDLRSLFVEK